MLVHVINEMSITKRILIENLVKSELCAKKMTGKKSVWIISLCDALKDSKIIYSGKL